MFARVKPTGQYRYLQVVANHREGRRTVQRVLATLGRVDQIAADGTVDVLLRSLGRFAKQVCVIDAHRHGSLEAGVIRQLGPDLVFGRLWQTLGLQPALIESLQEHGLELSLERVAYRIVLDRLWETGSDRPAGLSRRTVHAAPAADVEPLDVYRALQWLGETREEVEKALFLARCGPTDRSLAFFDSIVLDVKDGGSRRPGQHGRLVVGAMLTGDGRPVCSEFWPGGYAVDRALLPVMERLTERFGIHEACWVADGQMVTARTIEKLDQRRLQYILGEPLRLHPEILSGELGWQSGGREAAVDLWVKEVVVKGRRYIAVAIDPAKAAVQGRYDGKFLLRTNTTLPASGVALQYQRHLLVERSFRAAASLLRSPILRQWDAVLAGHLFCSFLALVLEAELCRSLEGRGSQFDWTDMRRDIETLAEVEVYDGDQDYCLRTPLQGVASDMLRAVGATVPPSVRSVRRGGPNLEVIGNLPVLFHGQIFGAQEKGWLDELGVERIEFLRFSSGTSILQAMARGHVDIAYIGVGPLLIAGHQGLPIKAVAATSKDTMAFVTSEPFATFYAAHEPPVAAFVAFTKLSGRKLRIGTVPRGTTPDLFARMWLTSIGVRPERDVEILPMSVDQLVTAATTGQVDGIVYGEPQITLLRRADPRFRVLLYGKDLVPGLPGGVLMVRQRSIDQSPALVEKLVEIHLRANKLFNTDKDFFAGAAAKMLGERFLPVDVAREAVRSPATHMVTDLRGLAPTLGLYDEFEVREGLWGGPLSIDDVFDHRFYEAVVAKHPELADEAAR